MHLALGIANGMKHLASLRIMHADLKAENVLLQKVEKTQENPLGLLAKVADFGLAQVRCHLTTIPRFCLGSLLLQRLV